MNRYKIMVIEDDPVIQEELRALLEGNGYRNWNEGRKFICNRRSRRLFFRDRNCQKGKTASDFAGY